MTYGDALLANARSKMIPGQALIYERVDGVVYARYRDPPYNKKPRWIIGGDPAGVARAKGEFLSHSEWQDLCERSVNNPTLKKLLAKLVNTYYIVREDQ